MNTIFDKIFEFIPVAITALGGSAILVFLDRINQRKKLSESVLYQELKKDFKKEVERIREENRKEKEKDKKEKEKLINKVNHLEEGMENANRKILSLEFDMLAIKQTFSDIPDVEARLEKARKTADYLKSQVGSLDIQPVKTSEKERIEYGGWIALVVGLICLTCVIIFSLIWFTTSPNVAKEQEIDAIRQENAQLRLKQSSSSSTN